jgi:hypothetical protein
MITFWKGWRDNYHDEIFPNDLERMEYKGQHWNESSGSQ